MRVGNGIRMMRKEAGLTQAQLAERLGISRTLLSFYETGRTIADWETVKKMAVELNCTVGDLYRNALIDIIQAS